MQKLPLLICRACIVLVGLITTGLGLHSHYQSDWTSKKLYETCGTELIGPRPCPPLLVERFYIFIVILSLVLGISSLGASLLLDLSSTTLKKIDIGHHAVGFLFVLFAGIFYGVSAVQIEMLWSGSNFNLLFKKKLAAATLSAIQSILYGVAVVLILKQ